MSTNKTCAISSLRWRPVSALIYGFADLSKHESALSLSPNFHRNNRKQKKFPRFLGGGKKARRLPSGRIILTLELELFAAFRTGGGMTWCLGSCRKVEGLFRPVSLS